LPSGNSSDRHSCVAPTTEKALNAILNRQLAGTGLTEPQWVTLTLTVASGGTLDRDELVARVAGVLKVSEAEAQATQRLWGDLPADDLATAGRVLSIVLARANAEPATAEQDEATPRGPPR
jgi:hypothetical protein